METTISSQLASAGCGVAEASETADEVIAYARSQRFEVTRAQLERRHRAGILPRPTQVVRHDVVGTVTLYPAGTKELLVIAQTFEARYRSLDRVLWEMFLAGHPVPLGGVRAQLGGIARFHDRISGFLRRMGFGRAELPGAALRLVERVTPRVGGPGLPPVRGRLEDEQRAQTFVRIMAEVMTGAYTPLPPSRIKGPSDDESLLIEKAFGLDEARREAVPGMPTLIGSNTAEDLAKGARLAGGNWVRELEAASDAELLLARDRWVRFQRGFPVVVEEASEIFGGSAFGLRALARLVAYDDPIASGAAICIMLRLGRSPEPTLARDWDKLILATEGWLKTASPWLPAFRVLREVPALRALLEPAAMRRTLGGPEAHEKQRAQLFVAATAHESEIAAALAAAQVTLPVTPPAIPPSAALHEHRVSDPS